MQGFPALRKTVTTKWKNSIIFQMCFILPITWKFAQNLPSLLFSVYKHYAINIADPNSIQDTCHMNFVIDLAHCHCLWLSGRALECRIRRSEIQFLIGTRNFFFVPHSWHNRKKIFLHLQTRHLLLRHYIMWMNEWQNLHHSQSKVICLNFLQLWLLKHWKVCMLINSDVLS